MHQQKHSPSLKNPTQALQEALEKLNAFTQVETSRLEVDPNGGLFATKVKALNRIIDLARCYISPLFSGQARQEKEKKLNQIKQEILQARDILKSHSALIEKLKEGDSSQQKLAESALNTIKRYNALVENKDSSWKSKYDVYNYERNQLLLDDEIKGQPIEFFHTISIKYDSHPNAHMAQKTLKELSTIFLLGADKKKFAAINSTHKKTTQFMIDTFRMKAIRMIQAHLSQQNTTAEILSLIKQAPIELEETDQLISIRQLVEIGPGSVVALMGTFSPSSVDSKFMSMPILDNLRLTAETTHSGFPYPSQHTGWALVDKLTEANPLRAGQVPCFQAIDQRKKRLAHLLLFDPLYIQRSRQLFRLKREAFNQNKEKFFPLHRQLQEAMLNTFILDDNSSHMPALLDDFYQYAACVPSAFDIFTHIQQRLLDLFITRPTKQIEEEWLEGGSTPLRMGTSQEKFQTASQKLHEGRLKALSLLKSDHPTSAYLQTMGPLLGRSSQSIILQYLSEKMGFAPPMLNDFERKIQACAFQQLLSFLDQLEDKKIWTIKEIQNDLFQKYEKDLKILTCSTVEELNLLCSDLTNELEVYFNSRFYIHSRIPK